MIWTAFKPWHAAEIRSAEGKIGPEGLYEILKGAGPTMSMKEDGRIVACGGLVLWGQGIAEGWAILEPRARVALEVIRVYRWWQAKYRVVELRAEVDRRWREGMTFARHLGVSGAFP